MFVPIRPRDRRILLLELLFMWDIFRGAGRGGCPNDGGLRRLSRLGGGVWGSWSRAIERKGPCLYVCTDGSARARGVGDCTRLVPTLGDSRETSKNRTASEKKEKNLDWRPVPVKYVNYPRAPRSRHSGLVGPHTTPAIVNYKYMTSTPREGYFGLPTLGT